MAKARKTPTADLFGALPEPASTGFNEPAIAAMADSDLIALFSRIGATVAARCLIRHDALSSWNTVLDYLRSAIGFHPTEQFRVLFLNKRNVLIADELMGSGTVDHVPVYPREVARRALELNASALILAHNHPSGDGTPSAADVSLTKTLAAGLSIFGITIHDHIIVTRTGHTSLKALRLM